VVVVLVVVLVLLLVLVVVLSTPITNFLATTCPGRLLYYRWRRKEKNG
jgi:hypothetical protein